MLVIPGEHQLQSRRCEGVSSASVRAIQVSNQAWSIYLDPLPASRAYHPDMDAAKEHLESQYTNFRAVDGIQEAFLQHQVNLATGAITQVTMLKRIAHDPVLRPGELTLGFAFDTA